jgi:hypothetical protein
LDAFLLLICFRVFDSKTFFGILSWIKGTVCAKHRNGVSILALSGADAPALPKGEPLAKPGTLRGLPKAPTLRRDFPRPGEDVTAGDKKGNLASRSDD